MIERIFCGAVTRGSAQKEGRMSYTEFVWFLLSEEVRIIFLLKLTRKTNQNLLVQGVEIFNFEMTFQNLASRTNGIQQQLSTGSVAWTSMEMAFSPCECTPLEDQLIKWILLQISSFLLPGTNLSISTRSSCNEWNNSASKLFPSTTASAR